jgi:hypothetical protein
MPKAKGTEAKAEPAATNGSTTDTTSTAPVRARPTSPATASTTPTP